MTNEEDLPLDDNVNNIEDPLIEYEEEEPSDSEPRNSPAPTRKSPAELLQWLESKRKECGYQMGLAQFTWDTSTGSAKTKAKKEFEKQQKYFQSLTDTIKAMAPHWNAPAIMTQRVDTSRQREDSQ